MEAVGRVTADLPVRVQGLAGCGSSASTSTSVGVRARCNFRSARRGRWKALQMKSEMRMMDDGFVRSEAHRIVGGSSSSAADVQDGGRQQSTTNAPGVSESGSLFRTGTAAVMASLQVHGVMVLNAIASETESGGNSQADSALTAVETASRAPSWLSSAILAFPLVSYFLFGLYRNKINPGAKVTDWLFTLVAAGILANIVMQATWGVRLY